VTESVPVTEPQDEPDQTPRAAHQDPAVSSASSEPPAARREQSRRRSRGLGLLRETAIIVVSALVLSWLIKTLLVQAFYIPSQSMEDTLEKGDRVMVSRLVPRVLDINRGDNVVFKDPGDWLEPYVPRDYGSFGNMIARGLTAVGLLPQDAGEHLIKRVIGLPGDTVTCCTADGLVTVNGVPVHEQLYLKRGVAPSERAFDVVVPEGMLFVLGDNRSSSADSRYNTANPGGGFVPVDNVVGTAFATVWPFDRVTWHRSPGSVFEGVPAP